MCVVAEAEDLLALRLRLLPLLSSRDREPMVRLIRQSEDGARALQATDLAQRQQELRERGERSLLPWPHAQEPVTPAPITLLRDESASGLARTGLVRRRTAVDLDGGDGVDTALSYAPGYFTRQLVADLLNVY